MEIVPRSRAAAAPDSGQRHRSRRAWRIAALGGVGLVALLAVAKWQRWSDLQTSLSALALRAGLEGEALADARAAAGRESDPAQARLELARALLDRELLSREPAGARSLERLEIARDLAKESLAEQPANHEAAMIVGATTSLLYSRTRDTRLFTLAREWEEPLEAATRLAPGDPRPRHLLAAAYLEVWPALSPAKRERAGELLREALRDRETFRRLAGTWIETAGSLSRAAELLPDAPHSWKELARTALERRSLVEYVELLDRYRRSLAAFLADELTTAERDASRGVRRPLGFFADHLTVLPIDRDFAPILDRLLALRPPGAAASAEATAAQGWFQWAAPLCLLADCPVDVGTLDRLASLAGGQLAPEQLAFAALACDDFAKAALFERRTEALWSEPWAPYLTLKAKLLVAKGDPAAAGAALQLVHRAFRDRLAWRLLAERTGTIHGSSAPPATAVWEPRDWWFERGAARLDLLARAPAAALRLALSGPAPEGAVIELLWDGRRLRPVVFQPGAVSFRLPLAVAPGPHLLEARNLHGNLPLATGVALD